MAIDNLFRIFENRLNQIETEREKSARNFAHNYSCSNNPDHETKADYQIKKPTLYLLNKLDELVNLDPQQIAEEYYVPINPYRESNY